MLTKRIGDRVIFEVSAEEVDLLDGVEYDVFKGDDDTVIFIKAKKNIYDEAVKNDESLRYDEGFPEDTRLGREEIWCIKQRMVTRPLEETSYGWNLIRL